jgi:serine/threonine-protein kinase
MAAIVAENPLVAANDADQWLYLALCEHEPVMADRALAALKPSELINGSGGPCPHAWFEGLVARARGDGDKARAAFASARVEVEARVRAQPDYGPNFSMLGMIDAALGRKDEAVREGRRAIELLPVNKNAMEGAAIMENLAIIYAWTGEKDLAIQQIVATLEIPSSLNYGYLRLHPFWGPLRGDPRFEKIVADLAPDPGSNR